MTVKQDKDEIGFDPLAWMDGESEDTTESEELNAPENNTKTEVIEDNPPELVEETSVNDDVSHEEKTIEAELASDKPSNEQPADATEDSKIILDATLNIQNVSKLYEQMNTLLDKQERIEIDASSVSSVDTATLQLLVVLKQTAIKLHKEIIIDFPSDNFVEAAELLGLSEMLEVDQAAAGFF